MNKDLKDTMREPLRAVEGKRMSELTQTQQDDALELWLIDQLESIKASNDQMGGWIEFLLTRVHEQRLNASLHEHHKMLFMHGVDETAKATGLCREDTQLSGPQCLMLLNDMKEAFQSGGPQSQETDDLNEPESPSSGPSLS